MPKVLLVSYYFAPTGGPAVQRPVKATRYLPEHGWQVDILCADQRWLPRPYDASLLNQVPKATHVERTISFDGAWWQKVSSRLPLPGLWQRWEERYFVPDPQRYWLPVAKNRLQKMLKNTCYDIIHLTAPPFTTHLLAPWLKRHGQKVVLECRDEWINNPVYIGAHHTAARQSKERLLEQAALRAADGLIYLYPSMQSSYQETYPELTFKPSVVITNGYDEQDFAGLNRPARSDKYLSILYSGALYGPRWQAFLTFARALEGLWRQRPTAVEQVRVMVQGRNTDTLFRTTFAGNDPMLNAVQFMPHATHDRAVQALVDADLLLLVVENTPRSETILPGKVFEYLRSGTPVLAVVPPNGEAARIINTAGGTVADSGSITIVEKALVKLYDLWLQKQLPQADQQVVQRWERRAQVAQLAAFYNSLL